MTFNFDWLATWCSIVLWPVPSRLAITCALISPVQAGHHLLHWPLERAWAALKFFWLTGLAPLHFCWRYPFWFCFQFNSSHLALCLTVRYTPWFCTSIFALICCHCGLHLCHWLVWQAYEPTVLVSAFDFSLSPSSLQRSELCGGSVQRRGCPGIYIVVDLYDCPDHTSYAWNWSSASTIRETRISCGVSPRRCPTLLGSAATVAKLQRQRPTIAVIAVPVGRMQTPTLFRRHVAHPRSRRINPIGKTIPGTTLRMASPRALAVLVQTLRGIRDPSPRAKDVTSRAKVVTKAATTHLNMVTMAKATSTNRSRMGQKVLSPCPIQPKDSLQNLHGGHPSQACQLCHRSHLRQYHIQILKLFRRWPNWPLRSRRSRISSMRRFMQFCKEHLWQKASMQKIKCSKLRRI